MAQSNDGLQRMNRLTVDDVSPAEDDDDYSDTTSNYSTISEDTLPLIREYGHTYHGSGQLLTPNDASEAHRLTVQHELYQLIRWRYWMLVLVREYGLAIWRSGIPRPTSSAST
ncbi:hypothetical protein LB505_009111 [Fusarium chuoi]|nr:hypothetical protein LB505_009111 [Fusarium chuoi]